jgi:hypothetical protein
MDEAGVPFILEIKNVPIANYEEIPQAKKVKSSTKTTSKTSKKKMQELPDYKSFPFGSKVAYFPEGYRKKSTDTVSPRALKHVKELTFIKTETTPEKKGWQFNMSG